MTLGSVDWYRSLFWNVLDNLSSHIFFFLSFCLSATSGNLIPYMLNYMILSHRSQMLRSVLHPAPTFVFQFVIEMLISWGNTLADTARNIFFFKDFVGLFLGRGEERERNINVWFPLTCPHTRDLACNPGMCPDWESNWRLFGLQASAQPTEPQQSKL